MIFLLGGLFILLLKGNRLIYIIVAFEIILMGILMYNIRLVGEISFLLLLLFSVISSVLGLLIMSLTISTYGRDLVAY